MPLPHNTPTIQTHLPNTCPQNRRQHTHIRLLHSVEMSTAHGVEFAGTWFRTGARVALSDLGPNPILLEFAGPQGSAYRRHRREYLYVLWRYDWEFSEWCEIARAQSMDWTWRLDLREAVIRALHPQSRDLHDYAVTGQGSGQRVIPDHRHGDFPRAAGSTHQRHRIAVRRDRGAFCGGVS